ncbi:hypothetical protein [Citreimonas salinaria]|uniref:Uncharacterized protein n=1 Tax=Citreimonas salinaria TaxID=321339 RepID=A0A1H3LLR3_9RHOB|nr:hypothetical protein [Citreimonas salinaria]SDY65341.1 hypothetical protein SAMN05444340_11388 [Citreimonas salinaria]
MDCAKRNGQPSDDRCMSFGQLLGLIATCCTTCLMLARAIGMGWLSSIAFAYVGGAALVIVGCLIALRLMEGGMLSARRQPEPEDEWSTGRHIDKAQWSFIPREGAAASPAGTVARRISPFPTESAFDPHAQGSDAL